MPAPSINVITKLKDMRRIGAVLAENGLGHLRFSNPGTVVKTLRSASPEIRKAVSEAASADLGRVDSELARLMKLRSSVRNSDPAMADILTRRMKTLSRYATNIEYNMPFFKQTGMDRLKRSAGIGLNALWGGGSLYDAYKDAKEGNYGSAAFHLAMAPLFGLGSVANHAARGLSAAGKAPRLAKALSAFGTAERKMVSAGRYGTSGNKVTRWMMRHPYYTSEIVGTAVGAPTMASSILGIDSHSGGNTPAEPAPAASAPVARFRGVDLTRSDIDKLSGMDDGQLADWLVRKGVVNAG